MSRAQAFVLTLLSMTAFAGNSLLCRLALKHTAMDPASFTSVRIISGALCLWLIVRVRRGSHKIAGSWPSALALFAYAAGFSFAYVTLPAGTGALLLFGAVQATMISYGLWVGERLETQQVAGLLCAFAGLVGLSLPGMAAPPLTGCLLMLGAGFSWGVYSLRFKGAEDPTSVTAGNFLRAVPLTAGLSVAMFSWTSPDLAGVWYAVISGAVTSGIGYAVWYTALRGLTATRAATVQLSVPVLAALAGIVFLGEPITLRLFIATLVILGGVAMVIAARSERRLIAPRDLDAPS